MRFPSECMAARAAQDTVTFDSYCARASVDTIRLKVSTGSRRSFLLRSFLLRREHEDQLSIEASKCCRHHSIGNGLSIDSGPLAVSADTGTAKARACYS